MGSGAAASASLTGLDTSLGRVLTFNCVSEWLGEKSSRRFEAEVDALRETRAARRLG